MALAMVVLVCIGLASVATLQHLLKKKPSASFAQKKTLQVKKKAFAWHLQLEDFPEQKVLIGFRYDDRTYMDASDLCRQPGFRRHVDNGADRQFDMWSLFEAPDIKLPDDLADKNWWVISSDMAPESRVLDTPYQWLGHDDAPPTRACLFLGQKEEEKVPQKFRPDEAEPVIGLMGFSAPLDLNLQAHTGATEITNTNRTVSLRKFPWLLAWLHKFSSDAVEQCGASDGFMPVSLLLPINVKILPDGQQNMHWLAATGCDTLDRWSLVMRNEDGTTSFIGLDRPRGTYEYWPTKVWTTDIDGDGIPEFLIKAQYYEGENYVLLRLNEGEGGGGGYRLTEIAVSAYEGL